jgi:hypothetical protein
MSKYGAQRVTAWTSKGEITFRSKLEYRYAVYLDMLLSQGHIQDWVYEPEELLFLGVRARRTVV